MYNAFISYSQEAEGRLAPALQTALEKFAKPWYKMRNLNIFRDATSLSVSPHLWDNIQKAIDKSEFMICMASPLSENSKWVNKEVKYWLEHKSIDKLLIVLTDGEINWDDKTNTFIDPKNNSLPDALDDQFTQEPFYIDLRAAKTHQDLSLNNPIFKNEVLKLAAQLHGKEPKDMASEEVSTHRKMMRIRNGAIGLLIVLLAASIMLGFQANESAELANKNANRADSSSREAVKQRDIAIDARTLADSNALIAQLQKDTAQIERDRAILQQKIAVEERNRAQANYMISEAKTQSDVDQSLALSLALAAIQKQPNDAIIQQDAAKIYKDYVFYKTVANHTYITAVAFSPNGDRILTGSFSGTARLWDIEGNLIHEFSGHSGSINSVSFSPDGSKILTGSSDMTARLWNQNGNLIHEFRGHIYEVSSAAFSPDGNKVLTGSYKTRLWNLEGKELQEFTEHTYLSPVTFSPDGNQIIAGSGHNVILLDLNGNLIQEFAGHTNRINTVAFSPDGRQLLTGSWDQTARLWDLQGNELQVFRGFSDFVNSVDFSPNGSQIIIGSRDGTVRVVDMTGKEPRTFTGHADRVTSATFSPDGKKILTGSYDGTARLWDLHKGNLIQEFKGHNQSIESVAFSPDMSQVLLRTYGYTKLLSLQEKDLETKEIETFETVIGRISSVAFSRDGSRILTGFRDGTTQLWDRKGNELQTYSGSNGTGSTVYYTSSEISSVAFSPSSNQILTGDMKGIARLWNLDGEKVQELIGHTWGITSASFSPDGSMILTGSYDGRAMLWDLSGNIKQTFGSNLRSAIFSNDGSQILTGSIGGIAQFWDLKGNIMHQFTFDEGGYAQSTKGDFSPMVFSPDGSQLLTGSANNTARLWDSKGNLIHEFIGHTDFITSVAFSPDGRQILTGSNDRTARLWWSVPGLKEFSESGKVPVLTEKQKKKFGIE